MEVLSAETVQYEPDPSVDMDTPMRPAEIDTGRGDMQRICIGCKCFLTIDNEYKVLLAVGIHEWGRLTRFIGVVWEKFPSRTGTVKDLLSGTVKPVTLI